MCGFWGRVPERQLTRRTVVLRDRGARLHRVRDEPLLKNALLDHDAIGFGFGERRVDVASGDDPMERLVALDVLVQLRSARLRGRLGIGHRRQRLVVDLDQVEGVVSLIGAVGDRDGDDVAGVANDVFGDAWVVGNLEIRIGEQPRARHRLQLSFDVGAGVDGEHAWCGGRLARIDALDLRVRV